MERLGPSEVLCRESGRSLVEGTTLFTDNKMRAQKSSHSRSRVPSKTVPGL